MEPEKEKSNLGKTEPEWWQPGGSRYIGDDGPLIPRVTTSHIFWAVAIVGGYFVLQASWGREISKGIALLGIIYFIGVFADAISAISEIRAHAANISKQTENIESRLEEIHRELQRLD